MEEIKLSDDVFVQINDFDNEELTEEQELLIDKLILNEELKGRYKHYGLCEECKQPNTGSSWCQLCNAKRFQQNFENWSSGNHDIDEFIQKTQLNAKENKKVLEWFEWSRFEKVEFSFKGKFGTVYEAIWKDGPIKKWDSENNQWERDVHDYEDEDSEDSEKGEKCNKVVLKCLHKSQDIIVEFLREIELQLHSITCRGITKDPETNNFMIVVHCVYGLCEECEQPNTGSSWCQLCNAKHFQQNFNDWTSGNNDIDELIQNTQLNAKCYDEVLEWIEYDRFENVEYLGKIGFGVIYKVGWKDGLIHRWDSENNQWKRSSISFAFICLPNLTDITVEVLKKIETQFTDAFEKSLGCAIDCHGITKDPETYNFMTVMHLVCDLCKECKQPNTAPSWCQLCNTKHFQQNFKNWTSGNHDIDELIQNTQFKAKRNKEVLEWIEHDKFENAEYLAKGGFGTFGTVYKTIWKDGPIKHWDSKNNQWERNENYLVALKCLHDSQDITIEFLKEIELHLKFNSANLVVHCFGITKDPETNNFMMVLDYAKNGSLRQHLNNSFNLLNWRDKFFILYTTARNLNSIHDKRLIHRDFHCGNILSNADDIFFITDLGLCQPANLKPSQSDNKQIFGVLPYVAPEVLRGKDYTQASDIYAFGIIGHEVCTGLPPYNNIAHDELSAISICNGLRPKSDYKIPQLILDIIKRCWDADPLKRPKSKELCELVANLLDWEADIPILLFGEQIEEADRINKQSYTTASSPSSTGNISYTTHAQAVYTSRLLDFKNLPEPKNADDLESMAMDFIKLGI